MGHYVITATTNSCASVENSSTNNYTQAYTGANPFATDPPFNNSAYIGTYVAGSKSYSYNVFEQIVSFDTTVVPSNDIINTCTLTLYGRSDTIATGLTHSMTLEAYLWGTNTGNFSFGNAAWRTPAQLNAFPLLATYAAYTTSNQWSASSSPTTANANSFTPNGTNFNTSISTSASTIVMLATTAIRQSSATGDHPPVGIAIPGTANVSPSLTIDTISPKGGTVLLMGV